MPCSKCFQTGHNIRTCPVIRIEQAEILKWKSVSSDNPTVDWPLNPIYWNIHNSIDLKNLRLNQLFWNVKNNINPTYLKQFKRRVKLCEEDDLINKNNLLLESSKQLLLDFSLRKLCIYKIIDKDNIAYDLYELLMK